VNTGLARTVVVHGGGDEVSALQRRLGQEPRFVGGRRVTTAEDLDVVRMVLSGAANKRLVRQFLAAGVPAVGISGEDAGMIEALPIEDGALGAVGVPTAVRRRMLDALLDAGFVPVISPLGIHRDTGEGLNVNGDDAAAAIAAALGADELLLLADVAGVLDSDSAVIRSIDLEGAEKLVSGGVARAGMAAKLQAARAAMEAGVSLVRIGGLEALTDAGAGTMVIPSPSRV
jgi:acetylglutamate kinase